MIKVLGAVCLSLVMAVSTITAPTQDEKKQEKPAVQQSGLFVPYDIVIDIYYRSHELHEVSKGRNSFQSGHERVGEGNPHSDASYSCRSQRRGS